MKPLCILLLCLCSPLALAVSGGDIAGNVTGIFDFTTSLMSAACMTFGVFLVMGAFIKYKEYRNNPAHTRITTSIVLLALGILVLLLTLLIAHQDQYFFGPEGGEVQYYYTEIMQPEVRVENVEFLSLNDLIASLNPYS